MNCKSLAAIFVTIILGFFTTVTNVNAAEMALPLAQENSCGASEIAVYFNDPTDPHVYIQSTGSAERTSIGPLGLQIPAGDYKVTLTSYDPHISEPHPGDHLQTQEQWLVQFRYEDGQTVNSNAIADLADDQEWLENQVVNERLELTQNVVAVIAIELAVKITI